MKDELQTLSKLFTERLFRIPDYQRGYAWTKEHLEDFWSDLNQISDGENHYTGVLTLEVVPEETVESWCEDQWIIKSKGFGSFYVVDGQQRLTTAIVLVRCISETLGDDDEINYTTRREIEKKYLFDSKGLGATRSYIFGYEKDNPSYEYLKTEIFGETSASDRKEETVYTNNLQSAKVFFSEKIKLLDRSGVETLYNRVTQHLLFNTFVISKEVDVCVAFETMNNRGKPLSHLELLKNRLIYLTTRLDVSPHEANDLRRTINDSWKTIYHNLGRNKDEPLDDDFLLRSHHFLNFIEPAPDSWDTEEDRRKHRLVAQAANEPLYKDLLNNIFTFSEILENRASTPDADSDAVKRIYEYSMSLQESAKMWYHIFNPKSSLDEGDFNFWLAKINRLSSPSIYPILLAIMLSTKANQDRKRALVVIERSLFVHRLSTGYYRLEPTTVATISSAIRLLRGDISIDDLIETISKETNKIIASPMRQKEIKDAMRARNFYSWHATHYLLYEYNLHLQLTSKTERTKIDWNSFIEQDTDYNSVEHIYPQKAMSKYWVERFKDLTPARRELLKNVIGNLLPLSKPKNASLSNRPFPEKVKGATFGVGYSFGSYAENEVATAYDEWTPASILDRSMHILDFIEQRWQISFGRDAEKIDMLGLGFVKPPARLTQRRYHAADSKVGSVPKKRNRTD